jgi:hypothetical protein
LAGLALLEFGLIKKGKSPEEKLKTHAIFVAVFLIVAHIAMIFGMLNPSILGWKQPEILQQNMGMEMIH